jgi:hypothetical protein
MWYKESFQRMQLCNIFDVKQVDMKSIFRFGGLMYGDDIQTHAMLAVTTVVTCESLDFRRSLPRKARTFCM